jgi:hypothetical protein
MEAIAYSRSAELLSVLRPLPPITTIFMIAPFVEWHFLSAVRTSQDQMMLRFVTSRRIIRDRFIRMQLAKYCQLFLSGIETLRGLSLTATACGVIRRGSRRE